MFSKVIARLGPEDVSSALESSLEYFSGGEICPSAWFIFEYALKKNLMEALI